METNYIRNPTEDVYHTCRIKTYPDGSREYTAASKALFREPGWEAVGDKPKAPPRSRRRSDPDTPADPANRERAIRRARSAMRDKCLCTPFKYFVTLTLDPSRVSDRSDIKALTKYLRSWLSNRVQRNGLSYVLVPERHKDGALHLHGFFNDALPMVDSGTIKLPNKKKPCKRRGVMPEGAKIVYNIPDWTLGFSTAIPLDGVYARAVAYVCKYLSKDSEKIGGRYYFSGGKLGSPEVTYSDMTYYEVANMPGSYTVNITDGEFWGFSLAIYRMSEPPAPPPPLTPEDDDFDIF